MWYNLICITLIILKEVNNMVKNYDAVVIGAGNGGLVASARLAKEGKKTLLIERHNLPGGFATSFVRGRFEFEASLHELCGIGSITGKSPLLKIFIIVAQQSQYYQPFFAFPVNYDTGCLEGAVPDFPDPQSVAAIGSGRWHRSR